jgi:hypothetical protein
MALSLAGFGSSQKNVVHSFSGVVHKDRKFYFMAGAQNTDGTNNWINLQTYYLAVPSENCFTYNPSTLACIVCKSGYVLVNPPVRGDDCLLPAAVPTTQGLDPSSGTSNPTAVPCTSLGCLDCKDNYKVCKNCAGGYVLSQSGVCQPVSRNIVIVGNSDPNASAQGADACIIFTSPTPKSDGVSFKDLFSELAAKIRSYQIITSGTTGVLSEPATSEIYSISSEESLYLCIKFSKYPSFPSGTLTSSYLTDQKIVVGDWTYYFPATSGKASFVLPQERVVELVYVSTVEENCSNWGFLFKIGGFITADTQIISSIINIALTAVDITGTFVRFVKTLQIANRLYFVNLNLGLYMDNFLKCLHRSPQSGSKQEEITHSKNSRGKLTKNLIAFDTFQHIRTQVVVYFTSWLIKLISIIAIQRQVPSTAVVYLCYIYDFIHLAVFNLVFTDLTWVAGRILSGNKDLSFLSSICNVFVLFLLSCDIAVLMLYIFSGKVLLLHLKRNNKKIQLMTVQNKDGKKLFSHSKHTNNNQDVSSASLSRSQIASNDEDGSRKVYTRNQESNEQVELIPLRVVDFEKTYANLAESRAVVSYLTFPLDQPNYQKVKEISLLTRFLVGYPHFRLFLWQASIACFQMNPAMSLLLPAITDALFIILYIVVYITSNTTPSILYTLCDTIPSILMIAYAIANATNFNQDFMRDPSRNKQMICIVLIICAVVAAYVFGAIYAILKLYSWYKSNEENKKKGIIVDSASLINYKEAAVDPKYLAAKPEDGIVEDNSHFSSSSEYSDQSLSSNYQIEAKPQYNMPKVDSSAYENSTIPPFFPIEQEGLY